MNDAKRKLYDEPTMVESLTMPRPVALQTSEAVAGVLPMTLLSSHFSTRQGHRIEVDLRRKIARVWLASLKQAAVTTVVLGEGCTWQFPGDIEARDEAVAGGNATKKAVA